MSKQIGPPNFGDTIYIAFRLVSSKDVSSVNLVLDVIQDGVVAISNNCVTTLLEFFHIVYNFAAEEGGAVFQGRFIDNYFGTFGLNPLHNPLN